MKLPAFQAQHKSSQPMLQGARYENLGEGWASRGEAEGTAIPGAGGYRPAPWGHQAMGPYA